MDFNINRGQKISLDLHQQIFDSLSAEAYHDRFVEAQLEDATEALKELRELRRIADAAQLQANLAKKSAESAEEDAKEARRVARISNLIAFGSMLIALAALLKDLLP